MNLTRLDQVKRGDTVYTTINGKEYKGIVLYTTYSKYKHVPLVVADWEHVENKAVFQAGYPVNEVYTKQVPQAYKPVLIDPNHPSQRRRD